MGTRADRAQRFGVEITLAIHNAMIHAGLLWEEDPDDFLKKLGYIDETGHRRSLTGFGDFHPIHGVEKINLWLGYWKWHLRTTAQYLVFITKKQLQDRRTTPTDTVISPALFGHRQNLNEPMDGPYPATSLVEAVLGLLNTQDGVNLSLFAPPHHADKHTGHMGSQI